MYVELSSLTAVAVVVGAVVSIFIVSDFVVSKLPAVSLLLKRMYDVPSVVM